MAASGQSQGSMQGMIVDGRGRLTRPRIRIRERAAAVRETAYNSDNTDLLASSEMECESFSMEWSLRNYSVLSSHQEIFSPMFFSPKSNHTCWQLRVCPRKKKQKSQADDDMEYLSVHLILKELRNVNDNPFIPPCPVRARYQIMLLNANDGSPHLVFGDSDMPVIEFKLNSEWGWDQLIPGHQLTCPRMRLLVNNDDILRIRCNIWIEEGLKHNIISSGSGINYLPTDQERAARRKERFLEDFEKLYKKYVNADFEIWVGPEKIKTQRRGQADC
ncbi:unnamed protein product [Orchesella dallaii]|uniref:MATH domain-containing protein n=1 Tax=Orchesella dallaii TaxID=48710 RepID=A0ABP1R1C9_9HEXA